MRKRSQKENNTLWYTSQLLEQRKLSETGKEPTSNIKKTSIGRHLLETKADRTEC